MKSLRIVKAVTKKNLIINVSGSWHGSNDKTLFTADQNNKSKFMSEGLSKFDQSNIKFVPTMTLSKRKKF